VARAILDVAREEGKDVRVLADAAGVRFLGLQATHAAPTDETPARRAIAARAAPAAREPGGAGGEAGQAASLAGASPAEEAKMDLAYTPMKQSERVIESEAMLKREAYFDAQATAVTSKERAQSLPAPEADRPPRSSPVAAEVRPDGSPPGALVESGEDRIGAEASTTAPAMASEFRSGGYLMDRATGRGEIEQQDFGALYAQSAPVAALAPSEARYWYWYDGDDATSTAPGDFRWAGNYVIRFQFTTEPELAGTQPAEGRTRVSLQARQSAPAP
jgi:hypothetical protein